MGNVAEKGAVLDTGLRICLLADIKYAFLSEYEIEEFVGGYYGRATDEN
jgi:hypothetical protein